MKQQDSLQAIQFRLYESVRSQIFALTGPDSEDLVCYGHEFLDSLGTDFNPVSPGELRKNLKNSDVILLSDFHSLPANQRACLQLLNFLCEQPGHRLVLALECFCSEDQHLLLAYMDGTVNEDELFSLCNFDESWGFPWEPVAELLRFAKKNSVCLQGLNRRKSDQSFRSIHCQDRVFAENCEKILKKVPDHTLVILTGEYHLAAGHLPKCLKGRVPGLVSGENLTTLLYSIDRVYFDLMSRNGDHGSGLWKGEGGEYHIIETPPWGKWYSYLMWQEYKYLDPVYRNHIWSGDPDAEYQKLIEPEDLLRECYCYFQGYFCSEYLNAGFSDIFDSVNVLVREDKQDVSVSPGFILKNRTLFFSPLDWQSMIRGLGSSLACFYLDQHFPGRVLRSGEKALRSRLASVLLEFLFNPVASGKDLEAIFSGNDQDHKPQDNLRSVVCQLLREKEIASVMDSICRKRRSIKNFLNNCTHQSGEGAGTVSSFFSFGHKETR